LNKASHPPIQSILGIWAEKAMCNEAMRYQDGSRLLRRINNTMMKGKMTGQVHISF
jgi:hypothetical protein